MGTLKIKRRDFIKTGLSGSAGLLLLDSVSGRKVTAGEKNESTKFVYRILGKTGLRLPVISMGVMNADNPALVDAALKAGITHLDTAHVYQRGRNEEMIGKVIKNYARDSLIIGTKIRTDQAGPGDERVDAQAVVGELMGKLETSLKRLQLEYVDILYLHSLKNREDVLFEPYLKALDKARQAGKARFVGFSTHSNEPDAIQAAIDGKFYQVVLTAYNFKQDHQQEMTKVIAKAAAAGIGIVAMKTMAGGYFDRARTKPVNTQAALKWVLQNENVHTAIPGMTSFDQLESNLAVLNDLNLNEREKKDLELGLRTEGIYCQGCEQCVGQCPKGLPIPDYMRAYMYAYGYRNFALAHELISSLNTTLPACSDCDSCTIRCAKGFSVAEKIKDIERLRIIPFELFS